MKWNPVPKSNYHFDGGAIFFRKLFVQWGTRKSGLACLTAFYSLHVNRRCLISALCGIPTLYFTHKCGYTTCYWNECNAEELLLKSSASKSKTFATAMVVFLRFNSLSCKLAHVHFQNLTWRESQYVDTIRNMNVT